MLSTPAPTTRPIAAPSGRPLRIVHILAPAPFGGLERVVESLAAGHARRGHDVSVVLVMSPGGAEHPLSAPLRAAGARALTLEVPGRAYLRERREVGALLRTLRPDVVHTHGYRPDVLDAGVARRLGVAVVSTVHGFTGGGRKDRLFQRLQTRAFRGFDGVVAVSRRITDELRAAGTPRLHCIPNAWDGASPAAGRGEARRALGIEGGAFHLGWVGRLSPEKGPDVALRALAGLGDLPVSLSFVGDGPMREGLAAQADAWGVADRVHWHGAVPRAGALCRAFDGFVLSSRTEGTPIALLEAVAAGVPVVATAVGGVPDVVSGAEALLVPPERPERLADAIRALHADPRGAALRAAAARRRLAAEFAPEPWLDRYEALYRAVRSPTHPGR